MYPSLTYNSQSSQRSVRGRPTLNRVGASIRARVQANARARRGALRAAPRAALRSRLGSATVTRTKLTELVRPDGPISESKTFVPLPGKSFGLEKSLRKLAASQTYNSTTAGRLTSGLGRQNQVIVGGYWESQFNDMAGMVAQANALGSLASVKNWRLYCQSLTAKIMLTNQTNDVCHCTIYDCYIRRDSANTSYNRPDVAWTSGSTDQNQAVFQNQIGAQPFAISAFTEYFKVTKITDVMIHTGGHHVHTVYSKPNKVFNNELLLDSSANNCTGYAHYTMIVVHGFPLNDNAATTVTTANVAVDFVCSKEYTYNVVSPTNSQPTFGTSLVTTIAQADIINDLTGATTTAAVT